MMAPVEAATEEGSVEIEDMSSDKGIEQPAAEDSKADIPEKAVS
jgi:hypothetical protein